jgi:hypothetical protein
MPYTSRQPIFVLTQSVGMMVLGWDRSDWAHLAIEGLERSRPPQYDFKGDSKSKFTDVCGRNVIGKSAPAC